MDWPIRAVRFKTQAPCAVHKVKVFELLLKNRPAMPKPPNAQKLLVKIEEIKCVIIANQLWRFSNPFNPF